MPFCGGLSREPGPNVEPAGSSVLETTMAEKYKPPMLADFHSPVIFLFCVRNFAAPQDKS